MKALVTGATGFIGSHLCEALNGRGWHLRILCRRTSSFRWLENISFEKVVGDINDFQTLPEAVKGVDCIFHLAGLVRAPDPSLYWKVNLTGTKQIVQACQKYNPNSKFFYLSTQAALGPSLSSTPVSEDEIPHPLTDYGASKLAGEEVVKRSGLNHVILRPAAVYGPRDRDIFLLFRAIKKFHILPRFGLKKKFLNLIFVNDLTEAVILAAEKAPNASVYNISDGNTYEQEQTKRIIADCLKVRAVPVYISGWLLFSIAFFTQKLQRLEILNQQKVKEMLSSYWLMDTKKIEKELGFKAKISLAEGIKITANWYKEMGWL